MDKWEKGYEETKEKLGNETQRFPEDERGGWSRQRCGFS
jgi:hypothetical protein